MGTAAKRTYGRRQFLKSTVGITAGITAMPLLDFGNTIHPPGNLNIIGPLEGYSPQVGTFVSMLHWMRDSVVRAVKNLKTEELDYLIDKDANTIGALLMHLAATEVIYQDLTFNNLKNFSDENRKKWGVAMSLGEAARKQIKGNNLEYYLTALQEVREKSLAGFKKRDDKWLAEVDPVFFDRQPTNNYCKWFHVCEHEANHRGQITYIKKRLPGSKGGSD